MTDRKAVTVAAVTCACTDGTYLGNSHFGQFCPLSLGVPWTQQQEESKQWISERQREIILELLGVLHVHTDRQ